MSAGRWLFPTVMGSGVAVIIWREGAPLWLAVVLVVGVGFIAFAQHESHRPDDEDAPE